MLTHIRNPLEKDVIKKKKKMDVNQSAEKRHPNVKSTPRKTVPRGLHGRSSQFPPQSERKNTKGKQNKLMRERAQQTEKKSVLKQVT